MTQRSRTVALLLLAIAAVVVEKMLWAAFALPSITSLVIVADVATGRLGAPLLRREERRLLLALAALGGAALYATTLAVIPGDLYRGGFSALAPVGLAIAAAIGARSHPRLASAALLVLIAFDLHLLPTLNLFDYLVDPLLTLASLAWCAARAVRWVMGRWRGREMPPERPSYW